MRIGVVLSMLLFATPGVLSASSVDSGSAPYERCALCHGLFGNTDRTRFPKLAGQNPKYLEQQIAHFLAGRRTNDGGQMSTVVTEIDSSDISIIVDWFASQTPPEPLEIYSAEGESLYESAGCTSCHMEQARADEIMPLLSAQHPQYLAKQMQELRDGSRPGDDAGVMQEQLKTLSDADIEVISNYLASRKRPL